MCHQLLVNWIEKWNQDYPFINKVALPRKRKRPNYGSLDKYVQVEGYSNNANTYHHTTPEEYFRQQYFENLDLIISSIKDRFSQPAIMAFLKMEQLLLNIIHEKHYEDELAYVFNVYKDDIDAIQVRTETFSMPTCSDILEHLESLHPTKRALILNTLTIVHRILINPATSCTPKKCFSVTRRIKTWFHSKMTTKRFDNLSILSFHK